MKATVIKSIRQRRERQMHQNALTTGVPISRTSSRATSLHGSLYQHRTNIVSRSLQRIRLGGKVSVQPEELQRFGSIQAQRTGAALARNPSRVVA